MIVYGDYGYLAGVLLPVYNHRHVLGRNVFAVFVHGFPQSIAVGSKVQLIRLNIQRKAFARGICAGVGNYAAAVQQFKPCATSPIIFARPGLVYRQLCLAADPYRVADGVLGLLAGLKLSWVYGHRKVYGVYACRNCRVAHLDYIYLLPILRVRLQLKGRAVVNSNLLGIEAEAVLQLVKGYGFAVLVNASRTVLCKHYAESNFIIGFVDVYYALAFAAGEYLLVDHQPLVVIAAYGLGVTIIIGIINRQRNGIGYIVCVSCN